jgi:hypothetical protein
VREDPGTWEVLEQPQLIPPLLKKKDLGVVYFGHTLQTPLNRHGRGLISGGDAP